MRKTAIFIIILINSLTYSQETDRWKENLEYAKKQLELALNVNADRTKMNEKLFENEEIVIEYAELVLFEQYGQEMIEFQKPYQIYLIDDYWVIYGTLPKSYLGGVFHIIFDSWNGQIKLMYHGK